MKKDTELLADWSVTVVDKLLALQSDYNYKIVLTLNPNPSDYKGIHDFKISVWRQRRPYKDSIEGHIVHEREQESMMSNHHGMIADCMKDIDDRIKAITPTDPDVIELGGKKFKLIEVK
jgi:hypothetical protein